MADEGPGRRVSPRRGAGRRPIRAAAALAPLLVVLLALMAYFAARPESDWVLVLAFAFCAAAIGARLVAAFRAGRGK